ncbi:cell division protein [Fructilactobacillus fructivorans]|uniref:MFS transporter n=1 Tax=Fructilactobacillus fructivorans TaxID=1614 RepID=A0AAE6TVQ4_9LACO|nr:cell division protein [Fructilactobacillus fructivorans]KRK58233.1 cell division protein [Fructilactobacillus fructivorans]KRN40890.1 cell division protein [Fructilactobacillus fructivorans]KRN42485.1 cell division protein [Fructilactobacillus fructivorans]QFX92221.1 MFS transporter [Fructilactobacillus fructivorans]RDV65270.1 MFS transporter [Fructilactobacillus fructivorans]
MKKYKYPKTILAVILILVAAAFLVSIQCFSHSLLLGNDSLFHFSRIYDIKMQMQTGHFNYFMTNYGFNQSGRIVNAIYGPYMAVILGFILLLTKSWFSFQVVTSFILYAVAGLGAYGLFRRVKVNQWFATAGAIIYLSQNFITGWQTDAQFLAWGAIILPFAVMVALDLMDGSPKKVHVTLALVVAALLEMHILSALFTVIMLLPFALIGLWRSRAKWKYLGKIALNVILTLILAGNYFVSFLSVFGKNELMPPFMMEYMGTYSASFNFYNNLPNGVGIVLTLICVFQLIYMIIAKRKDLTNIVVTVIGGLFLLLSSAILPWNAMGEQWTYMQNFIQFPYRFFPYAAILLMVGFLISISQISNDWYEKISASHGDIHYNYMKIFMEVVVTVMAVAALWFADSNIQYGVDIWNNPKSSPIKRNMIKTLPDPETPKKYMAPSKSPFKKGVSVKQVRSDFMSKNLGKPLRDISESNGDYLPNDSGNPNFDAVGSHYHADIMNNHGFKKHVTRSGALVTKWTADSGKAKNGYRTIPIILYHNSTVKLNGAKLSPNQYRVSDIGAAKVKEQPGQNQMTVRYQQPAHFMTVIAVSVLAWIVTVGCVIVKGMYKWIKK